MNEKITDGARNLFEKATGKHVPEKVCYSPERVHCFEDFICTSVPRIERGLEYCADSPHGTLLRQWQTGRESKPNVFASSRDLVGSKLL